MAAPTPYDRQTSFALYSAENPTAQQSGVSIDAEFSAVKLSLDETQQNLALIQDDDGVLKRGSVGRAQFDSSVSLGFAAPSTWLPTTAYDADISTVFHASKFYICTAAHVSGPTFDLTKWEEIADFTIAAIIDDGSITSAKLANGAVGSDKIGDGSISNTKLATGAVSGSKIADQAVSFVKLSTDIGPALAALIIPVGLGPLPYSGLTEPGGWIFADSRVLLTDTIYPALRARYVADGFPFGQDGSGNPKVPDSRGRAMFGRDRGILRLTDATVLPNGDTLGAAGGIETRTILRGNLPAITLAVTGSVSVLSNNSNVVQSNSGLIEVAAASVGGVSRGITSAGSAVAALGSSGVLSGGVTEVLGSGVTLPTLPPALVTNMILKAH